MPQYTHTVKLFPRLLAVPGRARLVPHAEEFTFRIRHVTRREFQDWKLAAPDQAALEDQLLQAAVLAHPATFRGEPWDWERVYAGLPQQVIDRILQVSGFTEVADPDVMARTEEYLNSETSQFDLLIVTALNYKVEEVWDMDPDTYHRVLGLAQRKLQIFGIQAPVGGAGGAGGGAAAPPSGPPVKGQPQGVQGKTGRGAERSDQSQTLAFFT
jgi:hypothetical protein